MILDTSGIIVDCNTAFSKSLGCATRSAPVGRSFFDFAAEDSRSAALETFEIWKNTGNAQNREFRMQRTDGSMFPALMNAISIRNQSGNIIGCNAILVDITELDNNRNEREIAVNELMYKERELQDLNEELERTEKAKEEFLSMVSHELKNPLTPILSFSEMLNKEDVSSKLSEKERRIIRMINESAKDLKRLVDDLLSVYKLDLHVGLYCTENNVVDLVDRVLLESAPIFGEKGIIVEKTISFSEGSKPSIICDALRIKQVLTNLVKNAIDFVPDSDGRIGITVQSVTVHGHNNIDLEKNGAIDDKVSKILVSVCDNGPGVPTDKIASLFRKFYQLDHSRNRKHGGTGLGLTICKEIIEGHGGRIWYEPNNNGRGACFKFELPYCPPTYAGGKPGDTSDSSKGL